MSFLEHLKNIYNRLNPWKFEFEIGELTRITGEHNDLCGRSYLFKNGLEHYNHWCDMPVRTFGIITGRVSGKSAFESHSKRHRKLPDVYIWLSQVENVEYIVSGQQLSRDFTPITKRRSYA